MAQNIGGVSMPAKKREIIESGGGARKTLAAAALAGAGGVGISQSVAGGVWRRGGIEEICGESSKAASMAGEICGVTLAISMTRKARRSWRSQHQRRNQPGESIVKKIKRRRPASKTQSVAKPAKYQREMAGAGEAAYVAKIKAGGRKQWLAMAKENIDKQIINAGGVSAAL
jgi:hypothetical protein